MICNYHVVKCRSINQTDWKADNSHRQYFGVCLKWTEHFVRFVDNSVMLEKARQNSHLSAHPTTASNQQQKLRFIISSSEHHGVSINCFG